MRQLTLFNDLILPERASPEDAHELLGELHRQGIVIGTDEAGRGALAGPVVAAAVYLTQEQEELLTAQKLRDSKKLTPKSREKLFAFMNQIGVRWRASSGSIDLIEKRNVLNASLITMSQCVAKLVKKLDLAPSCVIVDGNERVPDLNVPQWVLVRADDLIPVVSAASVIAKVIRDRLMTRLDTKYPEYNLAKNKGYPTMQHIDVIKTLGISDIHRESFCRKFIVKR